jgi:hypothetical protein
MRTSCHRSCAEFHPLTPLLKAPKDEGLQEGDGFLQLSLQSGDVIIFLLLLLYQQVLQVENNLQARSARKREETARKADLRGCGLHVRYELGLGDLQKCRVRFDLLHDCAGILRYLRLGPIDYQQLVAEEIDLLYVLQPESTHERGEQADAGEGT